MKEKKKNSYYLTDNTDLEKTVYQFIKYIHADQSLIGCKYLMYAVSLALKNPMQIYTMTVQGGIYEETAKHFNAGAKHSVERGIRHVCERLYNDLTAEEYRKIFGTTKKLTNKRIIETACNIIRYEQEKLN